MTDPDKITINNLVLSSFLCDYNVKLSSKKHAAELGITWGKLVNKALIEYMKNHTGDVLALKVAPVKVKVPLCQFGD